MACSTSCLRVKVTEFMCQEFIRFKCAISSNPLQKCTIMPIFAKFIVLRSCLYFQARAATNIVG